MKEKRIKDSYELEVAGGVTGGVILILLATGIIEIDEAPILFTAAIGFGGLLNGILAVSRFIRKNYILGALFSLVTIAMLVLFVLQIMILKG